jgi:signal transduction histidine kinase/ActR/RegA family two-component response regulator
MRTVNTYYQDKVSYELFLNENNLMQEENLFIQLFSSHLNKTIIQKIIDEILSYTPQAKLIGATSDGEIIDNIVSNDKIVVSVTAFEKSTLKVASNDSDIDSYECGVSIASKLIKEDTKVLFLFSDGLFTNGERFLNGVKSISKEIVIVGGMAGDSAVFDTTYIMSNDGVLSRGAVGVGISSKDLIVKTDYSFNWQEIGKSLTITKSVDNRVYEIDGQSAVDIYAKYLGADIASSLPAVGIEFPLIITRDNVKIARAVLSKEDDNSLIFAGDLKVGDKVKFGYGNRSMILDDSKEKANQFINKGIESIFIYSCMARRRFLESAISLELTPLAEIAPTTGFFTYGEFFKAKNCELLNQTMTITAMSENINSVDRKFKNSLHHDYYLTENSATHNALSHLVQETSLELQETNDNLENLVALKTEELQEKIRELEYASQAKSDFLASMSHEIRTPLNAILGFVDILKSGEEDRERQKQFSIIKNSGVSLLTIINDILDFSKIESGKMTLEERRFSTKKPFKEISQLLYEKSIENGIELKISFGDNLPKFFVGDTVRIKQVASNFLSNALKFTPSGGTVYLCLKFIEDTKELMFSVKDTGIGIDEKNLQKIFNSFTQEDTTTTRKFGGTGLGLSISRALIEAMDGRIEVESILNEGSTFSFYLPVLEAVSCEDVDKIYLEKINFDQKLNAKVLLVEDNKTNQMLVDIMLEDLGLEIEIAENGLEAVEMFKKEKYDIILMDENMPKMSGLEATGVILEMEEEEDLKHTPIVALTANALATDRARFLDAGMDEFVSKPIDRELLIRVLHRFLLRD